MVNWEELLLIIIVAGLLFAGACERTHDLGEVITIERLDE